MIRMSVMYPNTGGKFNMEYYLNDHLTLVKKLLSAHGLLRIEVDKGIATVPFEEKAPYFAVAHLIFDNLETMQSGLREHDRQLAADSLNYCDIPPQFQISEVLTL